MTTEAIRGLLNLSPIMVSMEKNAVHLCNNYLNSSPVNIFIFYKMHISRTHRNIWLEGFGLTAMNYLHTYNPLVNRWNARA